MDTEINRGFKSKSSPKKRVLFVITQSEFGGAQRFLLQLISNLDTNKYEVVVAAGIDGNQEIKGLFPLNMTYVVAKRLRRNPNVFNGIALVLELKKIIKESRPDVLFLNSTVAGLGGTLAAKLLPSNFKRPKVVYRIGGWAFNDPRPWWQKLAIRWMEKISARWKNYIIVNNKHDYDQAVRYGIKPREKLALIYNGIDPYKLDFLESGEAKIRLHEFIAKKRGSFLREGLTVGTIANFYPTKGLKYLIEAFSLLNAKRSPLNATLVIIGDGPERENLKSQISNLKLENKVFLAGRIPDAYKYLKVFDIFVLPSVKEGFPWALLEAMSARLPVIATAVGANPHIIENGSPSTTLPGGKVVLGKNGLLVPPANSQALATAINQLINNEHLRRELGIQAHQTVLHKFTLRKMIEQVEAIL